LLEDAEDLARWLVMLGRAIPKTWCDDVVEQIVEQQAEAFF
jgi:hypothetical protein